MPERVTPQLLAVLEALLEKPTEERYGLDLMDATGLSSGTLYPTLHRLVASGWLEKTRDAPSESGGSGRRLYRLTGVGQLASQEIIESRRRRLARPRPFARGPQTA